MKPYLVELVIDVNRYRDIDAPINFGNWRATVEQTKTEGEVSTFPVMDFAIVGMTITISCNKVVGAESYILYYAPYPVATPIESIDVSNALQISGDLPAGSDFYIAVHSYNSAGEGGFPISVISRSTRLKRQLSLIKSRGGATNFNNCFMQARSIGHVVLLVQ